MTPRGRMKAGLAALGVVAVFALLAAASSGLALALLPALALVLVLALGRFPGERTIERLRALRGVRRRPARVLGRTSAPVVTPARGGLLLAYALAVRPPPAVV